MTQHHALGKWQICHNVLGMSLTIENDAVGGELEVPADVYARRYKILGVLCLSLLIVMIANTSLNVAIPVLQRELKATQSNIQWFVDSYSIVFAGLLFTAATVGDRFGRKAMLLAGLLLFGLGVAYATFVANSPTDLIVARVIMGAAAAGVMPATLSILTNSFPSEERAKAVAMWAGVSGGGSAIGPLATGFVLEHASWQWAFAVNLPVIAIAAFLGWRILPESKDSSMGKVDIMGAILSTVGLVGVVYAIIEAPTKGWLSGETIAVGTAGLAFLVAFVLWEQRAEYPMLDMKLFANSAFSVSSIVLTLVFFALMGVFFSVSQLFQLVMGDSPLGSAVKMLPVAIVMMLVAPQGPKVVARIGTARTVAAGMALVGLGLGSMVLFSTNVGYVQVLVSVAVMASGMALAMSPTTNVLMSAVPRHRAGMGSAMNDTTRELGGSLGVAVLGSVLASKYTHDLLPSLSKLPGQAAEIASSSLYGAMQVASQAGIPDLAEAAKAAWMAGFRQSSLVGGLVVLAAAFVAWRKLPDEVDPSSIVSH